MPKTNPATIKRNLRYFFYFFIIALMIFLLGMIGRFFNLDQFLETVELKTLDLRYGTTLRHMQPNPNIVILAIDDDSIELMQNDFGIWPWKRSAYTEAINYLESQGADSIIFDLMFIGHQHGNENIDKELAKVIAKNKNVYAAMNFDERETLNPPVLPERLKIKLENHDSKIDFSNLSFSNCRLIMDEILNSQANIGLINYQRDKDGICRRAPTFIKYQNDFYPYLSLKAAYEYLNRHENLNIDKFVINKKGMLTLGKRKIQLDKDGLMLLNWYGTDGAFTYIPFWKVIQSAKNMKEGKKSLFEQNYFKNKVVFIGVTAVSQYDIKPTPLSKIYPGVEIQATTFNNMIDNNFIWKAGKALNLAICILLSMITGFWVLRLRSVIASSIAVVLATASYIILFSYLFAKFYIWVDIVSPVIIISLTFVFMYIIKYIIKSRDFEYTYRLATTDSLTALYNHRYFQENLERAIIKANKTRQPFSLIFVDIDFFKKFNDTYGHQAGDMVLRKVAQTLKKTVKSSDFVARYGGEEMVAIIYNVNTERAVTIADRLCKKVASEKFRLSDTVEVGVTISLGVATYPYHGMSPRELVEFADQGLYRAKRDGRNQVGKLADPQGSGEVNANEQKPEQA